MIPVNPGVQSIFDSLHAAWLANPTLVNTSKATRATTPLNPNTGHAFDLPKAAGEYTQGEYRDLYN